MPRSTCSVECRCDTSFTCGFCLRTPPVYFYTPETVSFSESNRRWLERHGVPPAVGRVPAESPPPSPPRGGAD